MAVYGNMVITDQGQTLYGEVQTGTTLTFTRMQIGSGQLAFQTQLESALTSGTQYTSLNVQALTCAVASGSTIVIGTGGTTQTVTASASASVGATTISVNSFTANASYSAGVEVSLNADPTQLTALISPIDYVTINSISSSSGTANIRGIYQNTNLSTSTYTCEIGLFAQDPTAGEILYAYANAGTNGDTIPPYADGPYSRQFQINTAVGNATSVTANVPTDTYVTVSEVGEAGGVASLDSTGNVPASQLGNVPLPANATTSKLGLVEVSAPPASGQSPVAVATTDSNWSKLTGGTASVADSEHTHQTFPDTVTFQANAILSSQTSGSSTSGELVNVNGQLYIGNGSAAVPVGSSPITNPYYRLRR